MTKYSCCKASELSYLPKKHLALAIAIASAVALFVFSWLSRVASSVAIAF